MKPGTIVLSLFIAAVAAWFLIRDLEPPGVPAVESVDRRSADEVPSSVSALRKAAGETQGPRSVMTNELAPDIVEPAPSAMPQAAFDQTTATLEDLSAPCDCLSEYLNRKDSRQEAALATEPKDSNWAYDTEQLLGHYISAHPAAVALRDVTIDCRTSFCEIVAAGDAEAGPAFKVVVGQALNEPWNTLGGGQSMRSRHNNDQWKFRAIIGREGYTRADRRAELAVESTPYEDGFECYCATRDYRIKLAELEEAESAAEGKDPDWAYAMEQHLQELLAAAYATTGFFEITGIDCRTTYCDVQANTFSEESAEALQALVLDALRQNDFGLKGQLSSTSSQIDDRIDLSFRLHRSP